MMNINYDDMTDRLNEIISTNTISSIKDLEILIGHMLQDKFIPDEIKQQISNFDIQLHIKNVNLDSIIDIIIKKGVFTNSLGNNSDDIILFKPEIEYLKTINNLDVRKILYLLLIISKWSAHPSGWIRYDRKYVFKFWEMKYKEKQKMDIINECCRRGLELRVVGSKNPVLCFRVNFRLFDAEKIVVLKDNADIKRIYYEYLSETI